VRFFGRVAAVEDGMATHDNEDMGHLSVTSAGLGGGRMAVAEDLSNIGAAVEALQVQGCGKKRFREAMLHCHTQPGSLSWCFDVSKRGPQQTARLKTKFAE
jgi:hypothetical protein